MTYTVTWSFAAYQAIAELTAAAVDPLSVDRAGQFTDYSLRRFPSDLGESRSGRFRLWYGDVLGVLFEVDDVALTVRVVLAGPARRR